MKKGYRLIEPLSINPLVVDTRYHEYAIIIMKYIIYCLFQNLGHKLDNIEIEVIKVTYLGSYPALGLHYSPFDKSLENLIENEVDKIVNNLTINKLIVFISKSNTNWKEITNQIMK